MNADTSLRHSTGLSENDRDTEGRNTTRPQGRPTLLVRKPLLQLVTGIVLGISLALAYGFVRAMIPVDDAMQNWVGGTVGFDFIVFYSSAVATLQDGAAAIYDPAHLRDLETEILGLDPGNLPWRYPPYYLFVLIPLGLLPYLTAYWTWAASTVAVLVIVVARAIPHWHAPLFVLICPAVLFSTTAGQNGALSAALIGAGILLLRHRPGVAGIAFGLLTYKPQLAIAIPVCLIAARHFRTLTYMALTTVTLILISAVVFGADAWIAFAKGLVGQSQDAFGKPQENWYRIPTIFVAASQLGLSAKIASGLQAFASLAALSTAAWVWRKSAHNTPRSMALVGAAPLISPYLWDYDMAVLAIPIAFLAWDAWRNGFTYGRTMLLLGMWVAVPGLWLAARAIEFQLGPVFWFTILGYSAFLAMRTGRIQIKEPPPTEPTPAYTSAPGGS